MILFRKILFFVLTAVYVVVCPLLVLYALGYIYSPKEWEFRQTGLLHISTVPSGADIELRGPFGEDILEKSLFAKRTPAQLEGLSPGDYKITLNKEDYKSWSQTVSIEAGKAAVFENILMTPELWSQKKITTDGCSELFPTKNNDWFLAARGASLGSYFMYDKKNSIQSLIGSESAFADFPVTNFYDVAKSDALVVYGGQGGDKKYLLLDLEGREPAVTDITKLVGGKVSLITWQADDATRLYTQQEDRISRIDVKKGNTLSSFLEGVKGFGIYNDWIYVLDQNDILARYRLNNQNLKREELSADIQAGGRLFEKSDFYRISVTDAGIFFLGTEGDFVSSLPPYKIASEGVSGFEFHEKSDRLLYYGKKFIGIVDISGKGEKTVFQEKFRIQTILENASNIKQAFWVYDDSHILYNDGGTVYLIEIEPQGPHHTGEVVKVKNDTLVFYNDKNYSLYYFDQTSGALTELKIVPEPPLIKILTKR